MALSRAASLCRLALRPQWGAQLGAVRLLSAVAEPPGDDVQAERRDDTPSSSPEPSAGVRSGEQRHEAPSYSRAELRHPSEAAAGGGASALQLAQTLGWEGSLGVQAERRHNVPWRLRYRVEKSNDVQRRLLRYLIGVSDTVDEVLGHTAAHALPLDQADILAALSTIVKLSREGDEPAHWLKTDKRFQEVLSAALSLMESESGALDWVGYSSILHALGQLEVMPPTSWLHVFWKRSGMLMGEYSMSALCRMLRALGQLGVLPPNNWRRRFYSSFSYRLSNKGLPLKVDEVANVWRAIEQLDWRPRLPWLDRFWHFSASYLDKLKPQDFSSVMHACGHLESKIMPPDDWLHHFWLASGLQLGEFSAQELNDTFIGCGELGIAPPSYWMQRFWHASALKLGEFTPRCLSQTMFACGLLGITPPADWLERYWFASGPKLAEIDPLQLSMALFACAHLDVRPPASWLQSFSGSFERYLKDANRQALSDTAMALTMFRSWELPLWPGLWKHLSRSFRGDFWSLASFQTQARQLYRAYQAASVERPGLLSAPDPELLTRALKSCIEQARLPRDEDSSMLCDDVSECLTRSGVAHANEHWCRRAQRTIDFAIEGARPPVALQVDGPDHYLQDGRPTGSTRLRNRMLAAHGWRVAVVDFRLWRHELQTEEQREDYLRRLLA